ncbi:MAG: hypothetical protein HQ463_06150 [Bacteroidetes bacterium]|nr:hypothetical protein [Bacteroidota bacterium]
MRYLFSILLFIYIPLKAQFFSRKSISISQSFIQFNEPFLANKTNANNMTSWVSEIEKIKSIFKPSRNSNLPNFFSYSYGIGIGAYNNLDTRFEAYEKSNFIRLRGNLIFHLPVVNSQKKISINQVTPYFKIGYLIDYLDKNFKFKSNSHFCTSMHFGGGLVFRITEYIGLNYNFSINQRLNNDYRTFAQHKIGLVIGLHQSFKNG